jgi:ATP-dependent RNA helicase RhlE
MSQAARERAMNGFRSHQFDILVATDIAARGIDVKQVSHVVNFDMPNTPDAYTHRIGRTGRAERQGKAYTFVTGDDHSMVREVERRLGAPIPRRTLDGVECIPFLVARPEKHASSRAKKATSAAGRSRRRRARRQRAG